MLTVTIALYGSGITSAGWPPPSGTLGSSGDYLLLTYGETEMVKYTDDGQTYHSTPAPFTFGGVQWFPIRSIAEALGYDVYFTVELDGEDDRISYSVELSKNNIVSLQLMYQHEATHGYVIGDIDYPNIALLIRDNRLFLTPDFYVEYFSLSYTCLDPVTVFGYSQEIS